MPTFDLVYLATVCGCCALYLIYRITPPRNRTMGEPYTKCCDHNPCPQRPTWRMDRYGTTPWRCPQCGRFWYTTRKTLWGDPDGHEWHRADPTEPERYEP